MLDIHTHILPEMDDGSKNLQQSLTMLQKEQHQGIDKVVFTPHFYADREAPEHFLMRRDAAARTLEEAAKCGKPLPDRIYGAEVAYFSGMSRADEIEQLCIGDTQAILIEMPFCRWNRNVIDEIIFLRECRGIHPIIAHVERYMNYQSLGTIRQLCEEGIWIQANASFFLEWQTSWLAARMLKTQRIHFIGSDCHNMKNRAPNMDLAISTIEKRLGQRALAYLERMEQRLLEGE